MVFKKIMSALMLKVRGALHIEKFKVDIGNKLDRQGGSLDGLRTHEIIGELPHAFAYPDAILLRVEIFEIFRSSHIFETSFMYLDSK